MDIDRKEAILTACAVASIYLGPRAYQNHRLLAPYWQGKGDPPTHKQVEAATPLGGFKRGIIQRIQKGLDIDVSPWTGGFWHGLKLARAIYRRSHKQVFGNHQDALIEDLLSSKIAKGLSKVDKKGRRILKQCSAVHMCPNGDDDITILAGLFAGARLRSTASGRSYYSVPATEEVRKVIDHWGLAIHNKSKYGYGLSPFYAALLIEHMPMATAARALLVKNPVQCPMLPLAYWEVLFGDEGMPLPPRLGVLPFICADITRKRHKWTHRIIHKAAVALGVASVNAPMRELIRNYRRNYENLFLTFDGYEV